MTMPRTPRPAAPTVGLPAAGTYQVDPARSRITFTTRHLFGLGKVTGSLAVLDGKVTITADPTASSVAATLAADSFQSASAGRDKVVKSPGYLDVDGHPHLFFASSALVQNGRGWQIPGTLTARGVAAPLELTITDITETQDQVTVHAMATVDRYAHGLTKGKGLAARRLRLQLTAVATRT